MTLDEVALVAALTCFNQLQRSCDLFQSSITFLMAMLRKSHLRLAQTFQTHPLFCQRRIPLKLFGNGTRRDGSPAPVQQQLGSAQW